jgi:ferritin-like metal-binding protein YciE
MPKMTNLHELYIDHLKDAYSAEKQLVGAMPKMAKATSNEQLREAFQMHLEQTKRQVEKLDQIFQLLQESPGRKKCKGMEGLIAEAEELITEEKISPEALDAGLIAAAQKVEHYEISQYGTLRAWAEEMGHRDQVRLLQQILDEEGRTDKMLTQLAESMVNMRAEMAKGEGSAGAKK